MLSLIEQEKKIFSFGVKLQKFLVKFVQLIPRRAENGWRTVLTLTTSSVAQAGDTNASVKFSLMTNEVCFPIRNILIRLIPSFTGHTHFSLFIRKEPSPKDLPDSKADPCWHPRLLKDTAVAAAHIRSIWKMRWDAVREKKNVEAVLWPAALTFPSPNTSKTRHLYKQPVRGTEGVTQQLRAQLVHDAQPAALCEYANILMERNMTVWLTFNADITSHMNYRTTRCFLWTVFALHSEFQISKPSLIYDWKYNFHLASDKTGWKSYRFVCACDFRCVCQVCLTSAWIRDAPSAEFTSTSRQTDTQQASITHSSINQTTEEINMHTNISCSTWF